MCYLGSATDSTHREGVEFNGLDKQIDSSMVIDLKGLPLSETHITEAAQMIASNYGFPTNAFFSFQAHKDLCDTLFGKERIVLPVTGANGLEVGNNIDTVKTPFGRISLTPDVFLNPGRVAPTAGMGNAAHIPAAPASVTIGTATGTDGVWGSHGANATGNTVYKYSVSAANRFGESAATAAGSDLTLAAATDLAKHVPITITNAASPNNPEYFNIYRSEPGGTAKHFITRVAASSQAGAGETVWNDKGDIMANTSKGFMGEMSTPVVAVKQLALLMSMDLAVIAPAIRWMLLLYLTFIIYAPKKWLKFINIGRATV